MPVLNPTPPDRLLDRQRRPYFLWDEDLTIEQFLERLRAPDPDVRAYFAAKLLRQAKPDDALAYLSLREVDELWPRLERYLGRRRSFWQWLLQWWKLHAGS